MPPAVVQSGFKSWAATPQTVTLPGVAAGNILLTFLQVSDGDTTGVSDSISSTWTKVNTQSAHGPSQVEVWWARAASGGSITITPTASGGNDGFLCYEVSGIIGSGSPVDVSAIGGSGATGPATGPNLSGLGSSLDFVVYWAGYQPPGTGATGGIWTNDYRVQISGSTYAGLAYANTGPTVTGPTLNVGTNATNCDIVAVAFSPSTSTITGTASLPLGPVTLTATGNVAGTVTGSATLNLGPITLTTLALASGTATLPLGPVTVAASGTPLGTVTGTAAVLLGPLLLTVNVYHTYLSLGPITMSATSLSGGGGPFSNIASVQV